MAVLEPGDRVCWSVSQYVAPLTDPKQLKTFYGTVIRLEKDWCTGEPGAKVQPDGVSYTSWVPLRCLQDRHGHLDL